ncbi:prepilin peptidase [Levilinea saccharolytica]|uniref:Prepilin type IV endopeptidase peptidase domain-containing protein n=1 Tax=Levilinea saccharolytica TaxID=229921 RepID=A0A0P6XN22_9CHLR|nr:prepilin peptidase [Levilinea saccharolytica]KPL84973.1 hypothetical protein ADN01_06175 [Levilinea saccharolytica]GAP18060.1 type 4 prepilin peptidase 1 [Levilinea saccharolytica]
MNLVWIGVLLFGYGLGCTVNYLADVLPIHRRFTAPVCTSCHEPLPPMQFFWPGGACPSCQMRASVRTWIVLVAFPLAVLALWLWTPPRLGFWVGSLLLAYFALVAITDLEYRIILHPVSLAGALGGLALGWYLHGLTTTLIGGAAGFGVMLVLYYFGELFARFISKRRGQEVEEVALGFGDVNLSGVLGLILGWPGITLGLLFGILLGGVTSAGIILVAVLRRKYQMFTAIPYAPFLILAAIFLLYRP